MIRHIFLLAGVCASLSGCGGGSATAPDSRSPSSRLGAERSHAPVISDQSISRREPESPFRTVVRGDTLYSIAWESGRDYREVAAWNRIAPPYLIKPGQQLRVVPPVERAGAAQKEPVPGQDIASRGRKVTQAGRTTAGKTAAGTTDRKAASAPAAKAPSAAAVPRPVARPVTGSRKENRAGSATRTGALAWSWPADGTLINRYSEGDTRGLDIAGARGSVVRAAAGGRVVYQGSGLRGYGQLIIIKHNDEFLSAYAHNDRIHVKEGDAVKRGQKIAEMGNTGSDRIKLHFEIRRQGIPVDPMKYLPKR